MNKVINTIYDIIGIEIGVAKIITSYFYIETILDNKFERININAESHWIDDTHFYTEARDREDYCTVYNIYKINKNIIEKISENIKLIPFGINKLHKFIVLNNILIIHGNNRIVKYDIDKKYICFWLMLTSAIANVYVTQSIEGAMTLNSIIVINNKETNNLNIYNSNITKYDYSDGALITRKNVNMISQHIVTDNNIIYRDKKNIYIMDQKSFDIIHIFTINKKIRDMFYDHYTDNILLHERFGVYAIYNIHTGFIKNCDFLEIRKTGHAHYEDLITHPTYIFAYDYISTGMKVSIYNIYTKKHVCTFDYNSRGKIEAWSPSTRYIIINNNTNNSHLLI